MSRTTEKGRIGRLSFSCIFGKHERKTTGNLVVCLTQVDGYADPMVYSFKSFPIRKLIHHSSSRLKPKEEFVWHEIKDAFDACTPHYFAMSLIHTGGLVYVVGGVKADEEERHLYEPGRLPREFSCISLSTPLGNSRAEIKCPMHGAKYFPLIEEIDGCIYVLSGPLPSYGSPDIIDIGFEVYYPSEDRWADLPIPPFLKKGSYSIMFRGFFSYVVIGSRLCVSTGEYACAFDTVQWEWEACELFSDFPIQPAEHFVRHLDGCGPPFPFEKKAILYKDNIFLCIMPAVHLPVCLFQICDGKAVKMPLLLDGIPNGGAVDLVDLGNDYFAVMLFEYETEGQAEDLTIVTFKLLSERGGDGALSCALNAYNLLCRNFDFGMAECCHHESHILKLLKNTTSTRCLLQLPLFFDTLLLQVPFLELQQCDKSKRFSMPAVSI
ncbi:uncharacterized protein LOC113775161 [Coffea eugenioides]|uniref:Uncharacterized protein isoform X3 n=1 Tax=Coffea arabica TaxID=13443 RepID=A0A6P6T2G2_COFAR|nr:uncharacterized protein LOC113697202 isoform X3 [Coffea arabica]XP_027175721.1 uncharacterized protein LOC113775161 [Coffea eugenioides]